MDHDQAQRISAAEKYLLNELPQADRDQYEEHFFDCQECILDLRAGVVFLDQVKKDLGRRSLYRPPAIGKPRINPLSFLLRPAFAMPVFAALLLMVGYQNVVTLPRLVHENASQNGPQILPTVSLVAAGTRGGEKPSITSGGKPFLLLFDIPGESPGETNFASYTCALYSPSDARLWQTNISAEQAKDTVSLRIPAVRAGNGTYSLRIEGDAAGTKVDIARYNFQVN